ncbi:alcohol dehydrogenase catalytic domain-containing protein [Alkalibaculum sp. M08DMB]|uniref:Alcohol dehydrogenase catalytic domain-containing protein n=1 Tax=Alkalibaculum sporogenes TaxID=2655001 RepID=A0A6A7K7Z6_9FIRM|nr:alcohol dehydrogenase catalytic domain-containing protein [Alkalibaculum sporogenes]MPW25337.1 alcohol dehydrogenase catalytic domain-containing protein [Alkalibaculum sporogenes]
MKDTMKGLCLNEEQKLELKQFPIPEPKKGFVRVKVKRAGICATDIGYWKHGSDRLKLPVILGHEASGVVEKLGEGTSKFKEGDRVIVMTTYEVCGECRFCRIEATNLCISRRGIGSKENGAFAEYIVVPEKSLIAMPDTMTYDEGAMVEVLACGVHAVAEQTPVTLNSVTLILGPGPIGVLAAQVAKAAGSKVVIAGLTQDKPRLELAKELGVDVVVNLQEEDLKKIILDMTDGYGADFVVEASGSIPAVRTALDLVAKRGTLCQMGVHHSLVEVDWSLILHKELNVIGSLSQKPTAWHIAKDLIVDGKVKVDPLVSDVMPIEEYEDAFEKAANVSGFKVLFDLEK